MRYHELMNEARQADDSVQEAAWWLTRWISGSMNDPDWDDSWTTFGIDRAFAILNKVVGNTASAGKPLYRFLYLPKAAADQVAKTLSLPPYDKSPFQSFTLSRQVAETDGPELHPQSGAVKVLIAAQPQSEAVLFGMADLKRSRNPAIRDALARIDNWHHQQEVLVHVTGALPLLSAEILP
jgi:hypothetical protein